MIYMFGIKPANCGESFFMNHNSSSSWQIVTNGFATKTNQKTNQETDYYWFVGLFRMICLLK